ncbi:MAG: hypothetical protein AAGB27_02750 [Pseudomonadota bacterium]
MKLTRTRAFRWLGALLTLWLLLGLLIPGLIGLWLERHADGIIAGIDQQFGQYEIRATALERRWFSSQTTISVASTEGRSLFDYPLTLRHGYLTLKPAWLQADGPLTGAGDAALGRLSWRLGLLGKAQAALTLLPTSGIDGALDLSYQLRTGSWSLSSPGISGPGYKRVVGQLEIAADQGAAVLRVQADRFSGQGWSLSGVSLDGDARSAKEAETNETLVGLELALAGTGYQQDGLSPFGACRWEIALSRLSLPLVIKALELRDTQSALALLPPLLEWSPGIPRVNLLMSHPELGQANFSGSASLTQPPQAGFLLRPETLMSVLVAEVEGVIAEPLAVGMTRANYLRAGYPQAQAAGYASEQWNALVRDGWLERQGEALKSRLELADGELLANGLIKQRWSG